MCQIIQLLVTADCYFRGKDLCNNSLRYTEYYMKNCLTEEKNGIKNPVQMVNYIAT